MSYQKVVTIAYEVGGKSQTAAYTLEKVGGKLTLRKAFELFAGEFSRLGPKNIRGVYHGPGKQFYPKFWVKKAAAEALALSPCEVNFFVEEAYPSELHFLCPRCGEKLDLWDYLEVKDLSPFWEIHTDLLVTCRQCGTSLGRAVKTALNGMVELYGNLTDRRRDEEAVKAAFASFQTSLSVLLTELATESPRHVDVLRRYFGAGFSHRQTFDEIARHLGGITRERVRQLEAVGLKKMRHPGRWARVQGNLVRQLRRLQERVESLEQTRLVLGGLVEKYGQRLRELGVDPGTV